MYSDYFSENTNSNSETEAETVVHESSVIIQDDYMTKKEEDKVLEDKDIKAQKEEEYFEDYFVNEEEYTEAREKVFKHTFHPGDSQKSTCILKKLATGVECGTKKLNVAIDKVPGGSVLLQAAAWVPVVCGGPVAASVGATAYVVQAASGKSYAIKVGVEVAKKLADTTPYCLYQFKKYTGPAASSAVSYLTTAASAASDVYSGATSKVYNLVK